MSRRRIERRHSRGFTLIEVLLVLVIIGMLATLGVVAYSGIRENARIDATKVKLKSIEEALDLYNLAIGEYPSTDQFPSALLTKPTYDDPKLAEKWNGPYLKDGEEPLDEWNHPFKYEKVDPSDDTGGKAYKLWSLGPDGQDGTDDDIKSYTPPSNK